MHVEVTQATPDEMAIIRNMFALYFHDMSEYDDGIVMNAYGLPVWAGFEGTQPRTLAESVAFNWWIRDSCHPFLIRADGQPAGFVFVNAGPYFLAEDVDYDVQDFFIAAKYRRKGVGRAAARAVFEKFRGRWEVFQLARNTPAIAFWNRVIGEYTGGSYERFEGGARQRFRNDGVAP